MNAESNTLQATVGAIGTLILALLGVDHLALIWGFIGALIGMTFNAPTARGNALVSIFVTAMFGAAVGTLISDRFEAPSVPLRIVVSMLCAAGAQQLLPAMIEMLTRRLKRIFGTEE